MTLAERPKFILSREEMLELLAKKVRRIYGVSVEDYLRMRRNGTLPYRPEGAGLEVLSGEGDRR